MKLLKQLFKVFSPSGHEGLMIQFLYTWITENVKDAKIELDVERCNMYITRGKEDTYPCVVAHLDQVQKNHSTDFVAVETRDIIFGYSPKHKKHEGLGADDKVGIWVALKCLQKYENIKVAFFSQEEVGCIGSSHAKMEFFEDCRFVLQADRRGSKDLVTSILGDLCSEEFLNDTDYMDYGYKISDGLTTDVGALKDEGLRISCVNMSCGYYEPHTDNEFIVKKDVRHCLAFIQHIIEKCNKVYPHESDFSYYGYGKSGYGGWAYFDEYDEVYDIVEQNYLADPSVTPDDLYDWLHDSFKHFTREDIAEMLQDIEMSQALMDDDETDFINDKTRIAL